MNDVTTATPATPATEAEQSADSKAVEARKYAGKFDTIEQLEEGYKNSAKVYQENADLKKQLESNTLPPESYVQPEGVVLAEADLNEITRIAKNAGLTQTHYEKVAREWASKTNAQKQQYEDGLKSIGEENLNVLKDYVAKNYPPELATTVFDKLVQDPTARTAALNHRNQLLSSRVPGLGNVNGSGGFTVTHSDLMKARQEADANPSNLRLRDRYIQLTAEYANGKDGA